MRQIERGFGHGGKGDGDPQRGTRSSEDSDLWGYCPSISSRPFFFTGENINVFLPCRMRLTISDIPQRKVEEMKAKTEGKLKLWINMNEVPECIQSFVQSHVRLEFLDGNTITLCKSSQCLIIKHSNTLILTYSGQFPMFLTNKYAFITPFDQIEISTTVSISCNPLFLNSNKINIRFNLMGSQEISDSFQVEPSTEDCQFRTSERYNYVSFTSSEFNQPSTLLEQGLTVEQQLDRSKSFHYANYSFIQYRFPGVVILAFHLPLWLFAFLNILVLFTPPLLSQRVARLLGYLLGAIALMPCIRAFLSFNNTFNMSDLIFYLNVLINLIGVKEAINGRHNPTGFIIDRGNKSFLICAYIFLNTMSIIILLYIIHKVYWERKYVSGNRAPNSDGDEETGLEEEQTESENGEVMDLERWSNTESDIYYSRYIGYVRPISGLEIGKDPKEQSGE